MKLSTKAPLHLQVMLKPKLTAYFLLNTQKQIQVPQIAIYLTLAKISDEGQPFQVEFGTGCNLL